MPPARVAVGRRAGGGRAQCTRARPVRKPTGAAGVTLGGGAGLGPRRGRGYQEELAPPPPERPPPPLQELDDEREDEREDDEP